MTLLSRLPARLRLTLVFAASMAVLLAIFAVLVHASLATALLDELDTGLRARAATVQGDLADPGFQLRTPSPALLERTEEFAQIVSADGAVLDSTPGIRGTVVPSSALRGITAPRWFQRPVRAVVGTARILALPARQAGRPVVLLTGASMSDRADALAHVMRLSLTGIPAGLLIASALGWLLAGAALRPVERMRAEASAITLSELDHRLTLPPAADEFRRLAVTLNDMLSRLETATSSERRFLDDASHQLRTPLAELCAELELALRRPRTPEQLHAALESAQHEAVRLAAMTDNLLTTARRHGRLSVIREPVHLQLLLATTAEKFTARAVQAGVVITVHATDAIVHLDHGRLRQALDNLIDNSLRHATNATAVTLRGRGTTDEVCISVEDDGPGFAPKATRSDADQGHGLGLAFVTATVAAHGGTITIDNQPTGGARIVMRFPPPAQSTTTFAQ
jgi:signal transduction histidine kinase